MNKGRTFAHFSEVTQANASTWLSSLSTQTTTLASLLIWVADAKVPSYEMCFAVRLHISACRNGFTCYISAPNVVRTRTDQTGRSTPRTERGVDYNPKQTSVVETIYVTRPRHWYQALELLLLTRYLLESGFGVRLHVRGCQHGAASYSFPSRPHATLPFRESGVLEHGLGLAVSIHLGIKAG